MGVHNDDIITRVKNGLFETAQYLGKDVLKESVKKLHSILDCTECSLWSINQNNTRIKKDFVSISLICRENVFPYDYSNRMDFVQNADICFYYNLFNTNIIDNPYIIFSKTEALMFGHRTSKFVNELAISEFIVFPIFDLESRKVTALFELSYQKESVFTSLFLKKLSNTIHSFFSTTIKRDAFYQKQLLMNNLIDCHRKHKDNGISVLFSNIIQHVLLKACPAQGISIFIWDNYQNRYNLLATTGLISDPDPVDVYYQMGEELTGRIGMTSKPLIMDTITIDGQEDTTRWKYCEKLEVPAQTEMLIPITNPSNEKEVIGIIRMINKRNACNEKIVDFFNDSDVKLMQDAADYLALIIANYQKEESQYNFIDKLTHEIVTPANAILKSADRLYTHLGDQEFLSKNLSPYLKNIIDFAGLQRWQADTNLFLSRNRKKMPFDVRYNIRPTRLYEVIKESIEITRPIARKYNVKFDNICINPLADLRLIIKIDKNAFITVFYNLFTNAIKYSDPVILREQFYILVSYTMDDSSLVIEVADNGIGISRNEEHAIFEIGYRGKSAIRINASGYGIGLSVIKQIIEDFGGIIAITHYRKPTVFQIRLPKEKMLLL